MVAQPGGDRWTVERALAELPREARWEIDAGRLEMHEPPAPYHADATLALGASLGDFVRRHGLGRVIAGDPGFHLACEPDTLRAPDVAFIGSERLRALGNPKAYPRVPPDLAIEIRSPNDRWAALRRKAEQYLALGVRSVWILDPEGPRLEQYQPACDVTVMEGRQAVVEDPVLPGFRCRLADLLPDPWPEV